MFKSLLPIMDDSEFADREESRRLLSAFQSRSPQCVSLIGLPGSGKSSLLRRAARYLSPENAAFVDLGDLDVVTDESFCGAIGEVRDEKPAMNFAAIFARWIPSDQRRFLLIDNFDRVAEGVSGNCLARLRALISGRYLGRLLVAVASTRPLYQLCEAVRGSAFFNIFQSLAVTGLSEQSVRSSACFADEANISAVMTLTGGFPGLITRLCLSNWTTNAPIPYEALDGVAAMFRSLDAGERIIVRELVTAHDPIDIIKSAPPDKLSYLRMVGLISQQGDVTPELVEIYAKTAVSLSELDNTSNEITAFVLLRRIELSLRQLIRRAIDNKRIPANCFEESIDQITYQKLVGRKGRLRYAINPDDCEAAYLPELALVVRTFFGSFVDDIRLPKKGFNSIIEIVSPFRNEQFHFHEVPDVEFKRAEVAMHDLLSKVNV